MVSSPLHVMPYQAEKRGKTSAEALSLAKDKKDMGSIVMNVDNPAVSHDFYESPPSSDDESTVDSSCPSEELTFRFCKLQLPSQQEKPILRKTLVTSKSVPMLHVRRKSVTFGDVFTREFLVVMGDHPCCTTGCPLSLGWEHSQTPSVSVDDYEASRTPRRSKDDLRTTWDERRSMLSDVSDGEIRSAGRKLHRERSCQRKNQTRACAAFFQRETPASEAEQQELPLPAVVSRRASC